MRGFGYSSFYFYIYNICTANLVALRASPRLTLTAFKLGTSGRGVCYGVVLYDTRVKGVSHLVVCSAAGV